MLHATTCICAAYLIHTPAPLKRGCATRNHMYPSCIPHAATARPLFRGVRRSRGVCFSLRTFFCAGSASVIHTPTPLKRGCATRNHMHPCCIPYAYPYPSKEGTCYTQPHVSALLTLYIPAPLKRGCAARNHMYLRCIPYTYPYPSKEGMCYTQPHASMLHTLYIPLPL